MHPYPSFFQVELSAQNIELSNHKLKSALKFPVWLQSHMITDRQTDRRTNIMAIARRFVLTNALKMNWGAGLHYEE